MFYERFREIGQSNRMIREQQLIYEEEPKRLSIFPQEMISESRYNSTLQIHERESHKRRPRPVLSSSRVENTEKCI